MLLLEMNRYYLDKIQVGLVTLEEQQCERLAQVIRIRVSELYALKRDLYHSNRWNNIKAWREITRELHALSKMT